MGQSNGMAVNARLIVLAELAGGRQNQQKWLGKSLTRKSGDRRGFFRQNGRFRPIVLSNQSNITAPAPGYDGAAAVCNGSSRISRTIP
jgi:hypothetical protein